MILAALVLALIGVSLSAFFSGCETGFFRVTRLKLLLNGMAGDVIDRGLLWLTNHPSFFVATTLVGNNVANYLTALAIVLGTQAVYHSTNPWPQIVAPILLSPVLFIYGELLPKNLFFQAPNRLLRLCGPLFLVFTAAILPLSMLLWGLSKLLERLWGASPQRVMARLARRELQRVFEEGHEIGILRPTQRQLAQGLFAVADQRVTAFARPLQRVVRVRRDMKKAEVLRLARRQRTPRLPVEQSTRERKLIGYIRIADLVLETGEEISPIRPLVDISAEETHLTALMQLHASGEQLARVVDSNGKAVGILAMDDLHVPLFRGGR